MKIPKSINICGHKYKITLVDESRLEHARAGECDYGMREIRILKGLKPKSNMIILLHEIRHAYQYESGFAQVLDAQAAEIDADGFVSLVTSLFDLSWKRRQ